MRPAEVDGEGRRRRRQSVVAQSAINARPPLFVPTLTSLPQIHAMAAPTLASKLHTLLKDTFVSISTFLLWIFALIRKPTVAAMHAMTITPYPFRPDLEGRVLDISLDSIEAQEVVPRAGGAQGRRRAVSAPSVRDSAASKDLPPAPPSSPATSLRKASNGSAILPLYHSRRLSGSVHLHSPLAAAPMSVVTNVVWASAMNASPPPFKKPTCPPHLPAFDKENIRVSRPLSVARKPVPFKPASRYLQLASASASGPSIWAGNPSYPRRRSIVGRVPKLASVEVKEEDEKKKEDEEDMLDFAARVRSAFYGCRAIDDDCDVRDLFKRDSMYGCEHEHAHEYDASTSSDITTDLGDSSSCDADASFYTSSIADGSFTFSAASDSSRSLTTPETSPQMLTGKLAPLTPTSVILHRLQTSTTFSELAYLTDDDDGDQDGNRKSSASLVCEASMTQAVPDSIDDSTRASAVFSDLLASMERKFPGTEWKDIVSFEEVVRRVRVSKPESEWSDVLSLAEYSV
ncbi:hypothetical protein MKEN_00846900 [Mycena kentingensis (nom. inval.)]|nr:hypothetical protein MKEN_00846900 [Mycena kentingensis (nom. inval.)]